MTLILHIQLLGDFHLVYGDKPLTTVNTPRLQSLLAFLIWPDIPKAQAHINLCTLLHRLRQTLIEVDRFLRAVYLHPMERLPHIV